jgi:hypothetical protein
MAYTTNWLPVTPIIGTQPITEVSTTQLHPLGTILRAVDRGANANGEGEFMYVKGVASGATGSLVGIDADDYATVLAVANGIYPIVGAMVSALVASTYGWVQISGKAVVKVLASFADNSNVYLTSTAGSVDDAAVAGDLVHNARGASAIDGPATGMAEIQLARSFTTDDVDDNLGP